MDPKLLLLDLIIAGFKHQMKMAELYRQAEAEGREITLDDVKALAAENDAKAKEIFG